MIRGDIEHRSRMQAQAVRPMQLKAGQFDCQYVVVDFVQHRLDDRTPDITDRGGGQAGSSEHGFQHADGGRLAIRAGDRQPGHLPVRQAHPPRQFHLSPNRNAAQPGLGQQRRGRQPARRGDHQVDVVGQLGGRALTQSNLGVQQLQDFGLLRIRFAGRVVQDDDLSAKVEQAIRGGKARGPQPCDDHSGLRPRREPIGGDDPILHCPTTHSA